MDQSKQWISHDRTRSVDQGADTCCELGWVNGHLRITLDKGGEALHRLVISQLKLDFQCYLRGLISRNETSLERLINKDRNGNQSQNLLAAIMRSLLEEVRGFLSFSGIPALRKAPDHNFPKLLTVLELMETSNRDRVSSRSKVCFFSGFFVVMTHDLFSWAEKKRYLIDTEP